ncbi:hypothetical protein HaLaN_12996 [Haematococcus lacustris]|uniref:Uncharacterized protein n=1 Tax=Haematococcus lacustris TaxID=44745 RepID=A0A699Z1Y8_HAELA|nr:hypothetical protein HaLaN_12996 [Haematococcus lacustris]
MVQTRCPGVACVTQTDPCEHFIRRVTADQQPQSLGPALPRQPSAASAPRLSRQLIPPSPPRAKARPRGLQCSVEHAAHWGEQVAPAGAVILARPDSSTSQGQGVPRPGLQAGARQATQGLAAAAA